MEILAIEKSLKKKEYFNYFNKSEFSDEDKTIISNYSIDNKISKNNSDNLKSFEIVNKNFDFFLNFFQKRLNHIHNENNNKIYWHKIIGEWLYDLIEESFYHWTKIENFSERYEILGCKNFAFEETIPEDTKDFHFLRTTSISWKNWFVKECLRFKTGNKFEFYSIKKEEKEKKKFYLEINRYFFLGHDNLFLYKCDLPKKKTLSIFLKYYLLQIPLKKKKIYINENTNFEVRKEFSNFKFEDKFQNFILNLVPYCIPKNFIESYKNFKQVALNLKWPKKPKYILSSYPYYDDVFKFYYSNLNNSKTKMIILQHGSQILKIDFKLGKKRFPVFAKTSWGLNKDNRNEYLSTFTKSSQPINKKKFFIKNNNRNLILLYNFNENYCIPYGLKYDQYIRNKAILYNLRLIYSQMDEKIKKKTDFKILNLNDKNFLKKKMMIDFPNTQILDKKLTLRNVMNNYNLFIHFFISTPFYECMYFNKPSILIIDRRILFWQLKPGIEKFFKKYKNIIFFYSCDEVTKFIKGLDLEKWWNSKTVQKMRKEFCDQFCSDSSEFIPRLKRIIK